MGDDSLSQSSMYSLRTDFTANTEEAIGEASPDETTQLLNKQIRITPSASEVEGNDLDDELTELQAGAKEAKYTILGMICVAVGTGFINTGGCIAAIIGGSVFEIMLGRYLVMMVLSFAWWFIKTPEGHSHWYGESPNKLNINVRGGLYFLLVFGWYRGLELVPIGDAEAIIFIAPLLIVFIARVFLKEPLSKVFPVTLFLTIAGIIFVCQPEFIFGSTTTRPVSIMGLIFLIIMAIAWALTSVLVRTAKSAHWLQIQAVAAVQGSCIWTPSAILLNRYVFQSDELSGGMFFDVTARNLGLTFGCAICGFIGLSLNVVGYQIGDATKVAWMEYCDLIFAYIFQWAVFGTVPNMWEWFGLTCLLSTCLVHLIEEYIKYRKNKVGYTALATTECIEEEM